jgi:hypothetical protein
MSMKIGVMVESFRCDFVTGVKKAASLGISGIQKYATSGEITQTNQPSQPCTYAFLQNIL